MTCHVAVALDGWDDESRVLWEVQVVCRIHVVGNSSGVRGQQN